VPGAVEVVEGGGGGECTRRRVKSAARDRYQRGGVRETLNAIKEMTWMTWACRRLANT
jgi:hypothetical protein